MLKKRKVVVTGLGIICPLGINVEQVWSKLLEGKTAIRALQPQDLPKEHRAVYEQLPSKVVGCVDQMELNASQWVAKEDNRWPKFIQFALAAAKQALQDSQWQPQNEEELQNTGVSIGYGMSSTYEIGQIEKLLR
eukprot:TRINITY_DN20639_c0_g1_i1.p2 TRINITY_DN20639_c0_g1~~TRINITY_DN20639_c0_g1_i1.p2  ORF type:complete len:135 (-),score=25.75 TRINITY_DN20639_c0_g1_i1:5-409(-)